MLTVMHSAYSQMLHTNSDNVNSMQLAINTEFNKLYKHISIIVIISTLFGMNK